MDVLFQGCDITMGGSVTDYGAVVAQFTSKDKMSQYTYQCVQDVEYHGCVYNSQVQPFSEIKYEAFMSVSFGFLFFLFWVWVGISLLTWFRFTVRYYCRAINDQDEKVSRWTDGKRGERLIPRKNLMNDNNNDNNQNECILSPSNKKRR